MLYSDDMPNIRKYESKYWLDFFSNTPMSSIRANDLNKYHIENGYLWTLHITSNINQIINSGYLKCSGGGLFGVVYATPVLKNMIIHPLADYIMKKEIALHSDTEPNIDCLLIKVPVQGESTKINQHVLFSEINYILDADIYFEVLNEKDKVKLISSGVYKTYICAITNALSKIRDKQNTYKLIEAVDRLFKKCEYIRCILFETVYEYLAFFQDSDEAKGFAKDGIMYPNHIKDFLYLISPSLVGKFSTKHFDVPICEIAEALHNTKTGNKLIKDFDENHFKIFMLKRLTHYLSKVIEADGGLSKTLLGHLAYRKYRCLGIESKSSLLFGERSKRREINMVTYANIPKGEIGILPHVHGVEIYRATISKSKRLVKQGEKTNLAIKSVVTASGALRGE
jgi:hypothetical protein